VNAPRRYDEEEVAEILRIATEANEAVASRAAGTHGLTLADIQEIGGEVGIAPARIEHAAREVERTTAATLPTTTAQPGGFLGAPRSVSRVVPLPRSLDDEEWMRLVVRLRETFGARGKIETVGPLRTWYNGNLQVHVEPADDGYRLRMSTFKGNVTEVATMGVVFLVMAVLMGTMIVLQKGIGPGLALAAFFGSLGLGALGTTRLALPRWADERGSQMDEIAETTLNGLALTAPRE
jgi:hypothetical protein